MPAAHNLGDYVDFLRLLVEEGAEFVVIGGCAVGAYAALRGETIVSEDLDLLMEPAEIGPTLDWLSSIEGVNIEKRPQPRSLGVAVLRWQGREVNILGGSDRLAPRAVLDAAREIDVSEFACPVADPTDLLANKLAVARDKDEPHAELLRRFVEAEIVADFETLTASRERIHGARRYLGAIGAAHLPDPLVAGLAKRLRRASDVRFLLSRSTPSARPGVREAALAAGLWDAGAQSIWDALERDA